MKYIAAMNITAIQKFPKRYSTNKSQRFIIGNGNEYNITPKIGSKAKTNKIGFLTCSLKIKSFSFKVFFGFSVSILLSCCPPCPPFHTSEYPHDRENSRG
jgi:hypothetical protein